MGGHSVQRRNLPIKLLKIWSDELGKYKEPVGNKIPGLIKGAFEVVTRIHEWRCPSAAGPLEFCQ